MWPDSMWPSLSEGHLYLDMTPMGYDTRGKKTVWVSYPGKKEVSSNLSSRIQVVQNVRMVKGLVQVSGCELESLWQCYETCRILAWLIHICNCVHSIPDDSWNCNNFHVFSSKFVSDDVSMFFSSFDRQTEYCWYKRHVKYSTKVDSF